VCVLVGCFTFVSRRCLLVFSYEQVSMCVRILHTRRKKEKRKWENKKERKKKTEKKEEIKENKARGSTKEK